MPTVPRSVFAALMFTIAFSALAGDDSLALDMNKYPQDTPKKELDSIIKSLEGKDLGYWLKWIIRPEDSKMLADKYGSLENTVKHLQESKKFPDWCDKVLKDMKVMLAAEPLAQGETDASEAKKVKYIRFKGSERDLQLEQQPDGRWCMNTRYTGKEPPAPEPKK